MKNLVAGCILVLLLSGCADMKINVSPENDITGELRENSRQVNANSMRALKEAMQEACAPHRLVFPETEERQLYFTTTALERLSSLPFDVLKNVIAGGREGSRYTVTIKGVCDPNIFE